AHHAPDLPRTCLPPTPTLHSHGHLHLPPSSSTNGTFVTAAAEISVRPTCGAQRRQSVGLTLQAWKLPIATDWQAGPAAFRVTQNAQAQAACGVRACTSEGDLPRR